MSVDQFRRKAETLLRQASETENMKDRGRLIDEAMHWHNLAIEAHDRRDDVVDDSEPGIAG